MKILSLGWGVQSFTLAAMVALGELEPVEAAIHADTLHESSLTYSFAERWTPWLVSHGVNVVTVTNPTGGVFELFKRIGQTHLPAYTLNVQGDAGQLNRSCTHRWKIVPMRRWIAAELAQRNLTKVPGMVEQWLGISLDEFQRMKDSDVKYIKHRWPLIDKRMTRRDCYTWLDKHGLEIPPKSSCTFCPYHDTAAWRRMKAGGSDWDEAVRVDNTLRHLRPPYEMFVHPARKPLEEIDLSTPEENGQLSLWDNECSGICGV